VEVFSRNGSEYQKFIQSFLCGSFQRSSELIMDKIVSSSKKKTFALVWQTVTLLENNK